jgi:RES domain-containing protein
MQLFRIAKTPYIKDLIGIGARIYGGRWNEKGVAALYTSESRSLASLEYLVHTSSISTTPLDLSMACIEIPDQIAVQQVTKRQLPPDWRNYPAHPGLAAIGSKWVASNQYLLLRVPSVIVENEFNILINPIHPDIKTVRIKSVKPFALDERLRK